MKKTNELVVGSWEWLRGVITAIPTRIEPIGGQQQRYVALDEVLGWIEEGQRRSAKSSKAEPVNARLVEALHSTIDLLWFEDSHAVALDSTVVFGPYYDLSGLDSCGRSEFRWPGFDCVVWPNRGLGGKWSAYCTHEGSMWFEQFDTEAQAREQCLLLLDRVIPEHPVSKARAALAAAESLQAEPVRLKLDDVKNILSTLNNMPCHVTEADLVVHVEREVLRINGFKVED